MMEPDYSFTCDCDMGCIKVFSEDLSLFWPNGVGDVPTIVDIYTEREDLSEEGKWLGHFTVKTEDSVYLAQYDCSHDPVYTFSVGRWWVYRIDDAHFAMILVDQDLHA